MKYQITLALSFTLLLLVGCKDDDTDEQSPKTGIISGQLKLSNEFGHDLGTHGNMKISTQTGVYGVTNSTGIYKIENLSSGNYDLFYEKVGFGTYKKFAIKVVAGSGSTTLNGIDYLGEKSTTVISNLSSGFNSNDSSFTFGCEVSPTPSAGFPRAFRMFFSKNSNVGYQNYLFTPSNTWTSTVGTGIISGYQRNNFYNNGFAPGDSVYMIAYGESFHTNTYTDPATEKKVFPNINMQSPSNTVGFVLP